MKLKTVFFILGVFISTSILASESDIQLAAVNGGLMMMSESADQDLDEEIGSTDISEFDNLETNDLKAQIIVPVIFNS